MSASAIPQLQLVDWRREVQELYADVRRRAQDDPREAWLAFRIRRDALFRTHPQSPLDAQQRAQITGLPYFRYDAAYRVMGTLQSTSGPDRSVALPEGVLTMSPIAEVTFALAGQRCTLTMFWLAGYGGGLFLPFGDLTNGHETYGGGRYLYDTIKGADLGAQEMSVPLDFNFAYNPSCAYNDRWICPLTPPENRLPVAVHAGEKAFQHE